MKQILTGAEIWDIIKHPKIAYMEDRYIKDKQYEFELTGGKTSDGVLNSTSKPLPTQEELKVQEDAQRVEELKETISNKKLLDEPCVDEQTELKSLLNGTHDEYIKTKEQEAIDAYTLELIEGGIL